MIRESMLPYVDVEALSLAGAFAQHPELLNVVPDVTVAAVGGLAPKHLPAGVPFRELLLDRVGMGSILTYGNRHGRSCVEFGAKALESGEDWEARTFSLTLLLLRLSEESKFSIAADGRFHLSFQANRLPNVPLCLLVEGSWKDWRKYARFHADPSFPTEHRLLLAHVGNLLDRLFG